MVVRIFIFKQKTAFEIAKCAADLEPEFIQVRKFDRGIVAIEERQRSEHGLTFLVEFEAGLSGDEREHVADLLEAGAQKKVRVAPVTLAAENEEVRLRVFQC